MTSFPANMTSSLNGKSMHNRRVVTMQQ